MLIMIQLLMYLPIQRLILLFNAGNYIENKGGHLQIFIFGIAFLSILMVFILIKNVIQERKNMAIQQGLHQQLLHKNNDLQTALIALEESTVENTRLMQIIAHDLRSPMAAIAGLSELMVTENRLLEDDLEVVNLINSSAVDSLNFMNKVLEQHTTTALHETETVDLQALLKYTVKQLQFKAGEKQQQLILEAFPLQLNLNKDKIWRVLQNLLNNAIKFSPTASQIFIQQRIENHQVLISITDCGIGIPADLQEKLFSDQEQCKRTGTAGEQSFGLGLAIAKENVTAHGGTLTFTSEVGVGTTFTIQLPL